MVESLSYGFDKFLWLFVFIQSPVEAPSDVSDSSERENDPQWKVSNILTSLRAYRKREFKPNQKVLKYLFIKCLLLFYLTVGQ